MAKKLTITQETICDFVKAEAERLDPEMSLDDAFECVACQQVLTPYEADDDEVERGHVGGGNDGGYDGLYLYVNGLLFNGEDPNEMKVAKGSRVDFHLIQAKNSTGFQEVIIQNWKDSFENLMDTDEPDSKRYCSEVIEVFQLANALFKKTISRQLTVQIHFWAVSLAEEVHPNLEKQALELKRKVGNIVPSRNTSIAVDFVTASRFYEMIDRAPDETLTLKGTREPLCPDEHSAIITVNVADYNEFTTDDSGALRTSLFEANIRDYQGDISVNKAIAETLANGGDVDFWWLNNGITIVADTVVRDMGTSVTMVNPRIVNGLQTSNEIWKHCRNIDASKDDRKVLVKCIAASAPDVRAQIIQATNKQSTIPPAYLHSLERIHLQIEEYFRRHGLYYDRRKNSCKNRGIPARDIISVPFFGQCLIATLLEQPDYARARPAQILSDSGKYEKIFNDDIPMGAYYNMGKLAIAVRYSLKKSGLPSATQNDIIFYVLMVCCAKKIGHFKVAGDDLAVMALPDDAEIQEIIERIDALYQERGGEAKIVKNTAFVNAVKEEFKSCVDS